MNQISKEALDFVDAARKSFEENEDYVTYLSGDFIALRSGMFENCITVYELGSSVGNFTDQLPRRQKVLVDYDELKRLKEIEKKYKLFLAELEVDSLNGKK